MKSHLARGKHQSSQINPLVHYSFDCVITVQMVTMHIFIQARNIYIFTHSVFTVRMAAVTVANKIN